MDSSRSDDSNRANNARGSGPDHSQSSPAHTLQTQSQPRQADGSIVDPRATAATTTTTSTAATSATSSASSPLVSADTQLDLIVTAISNAAAAAAVSAKAIRTQPATESMTTTITASKSSLKRPRANRKTSTKPTTSTSSDISPASASASSSTAATTKPLKVRVKCSSNYRGVNYERNRKAWRASIYVNDKQEHLGYFDTELAAAIAYDRAALELRGAYVNFPGGDVGENTEEDWMQTTGLRRVRAAARGQHDGSVAKPTKRVRKRKPQAKVKNVKSSAKAGGAAPTASGSPASVASSSSQSYIGSGLDASSAATSTSPLPRDMGQIYTGGGMYHPGGFSPFGAAAAAAAASEHLSGFLSPSAGAGAARMFDPRQTQGRFTVVPSALQSYMPMPQMPPPPQQAHLGHAGVYSSHDPGMAASTHPPAAQFTGSPFSAMPGSAVAATSMSVGRKRVRSDVGGPLEQLPSKQVATQPPGAGEIQRSPSAQRATMASPGVKPSNYSNVLDEKNSEGSTSVPQAAVSSGGSPLVSAAATSTASSAGAPEQAPSMPSLRVVTSLSPRQSLAPLSSSHIATLEQQQQHHQMNSPMQPHLGSPFGSPFSGMAGSYPPMPFTSPYGYGPMSPAHQQMMMPPIQYPQHQQHHQQQQQQQLINEGYPQTMSHIPMHHPQQQRLQQQLEQQPGQPLSWTDNDGNTWMRVQKVGGPAMMGGAMSPQSQFHNTQASAPMAIGSPSRLQQQQAQQQQAQQQQAQQEQQPNTSGDGVNLVASNQQSPSSMVTPQLNQSTPRSLSTQQLSVDHAIPKREHVKTQASASVSPPSSDDEIDASSKSNGEGSSAASRTSKPSRRCSSGNCSPDLPSASASQLLTVDGAIRAWALDLMQRTETTADMLISSVVPAFDVHALQAWLDNKPDKLSSGVVLESFGDWFKSASYRPNIALYQHIRHCIALLGVSQACIARKINTHRSTMSEWLGGKRSRWAGDTGQGVVEWLVANLLARDTEDMQVAGIILALDARADEIDVSRSEYFLQGWPHGFVRQVFSLCGWNEVAIKADVDLETSGEGGGAEKNGSISLSTTVPGVNQCTQHPINTIKTESSKASASQTTNAGASTSSSTGFATIAAALSTITNVHQLSPIKAEGASGHDAHLPHGTSPHMQPVSAVGSSVGVPQPVLVPVTGENSLGNPGVSRRVPPLSTSSNVPAAVGSPIDDLGASSRTHVALTTVSNVNQTSVSSSTSSLSNLPSLS